MILINMKCAGNPLLKLDNTVLHFSFRLLGEKYGVEIPKSQVSMGSRAGHISLPDSLWRVKLSFGQVEFGKIF